MKKTFLAKIKNLFLLPLFFVLTILTACQSASRMPLPEINALSLLSENNDMYFAIPVAEERNLVNTILTAFIPELTEENANQISSYVTKIYAGIKENNSVKTYEIAGESSFPKIAINSLLTERKGWSKQKYEAESNEEALLLKYPNKFNYFVNTKQPVTISFPSEEIFIAGQNIFPMLENFSKREELKHTDETFFLNEPSSNIRFYIKNPKSFLQEFIGILAQFGMESLTGELINIPENNKKSNNYSLELKVRVIDSKTMKAVLKILSFASKMLNGNVEQTDDITIKITGLKMNTEQIISIINEN